MTKSAVKPRKKPKQERSHLMTKIILEATARILSLEGYDRLTTNKVAKKAGVSIGSLYQYFPNKESLIWSLIQQMMLEDRKIFEHWKNQLKNEKMLFSLQQILRVFLDLHSKENRLRSEIYSLVFRIGAGSEALRLREEITHIFIELLQILYPQRSAHELEAKAFVLFHASLGVMQGISNSKSPPDVALIEKQMLLLLAEE
ncbi:MAG: TetR/AcrR family transcriptional regulator [Pseudobdellovibrionaceae bacterium]